MSIQVAPFKDPSLWSVLENGVAVLKGAEMAEARRALVLDCLLSMFSEAERGATAVANQNIFAASGDSAAIKQFSLFFEYLTPLGATLPERLAESHTLLRSMRQGNAPDPDGVRRTEEILTVLLDQLHKAAQSEPLVPMQEFSY